MVNVVHEDIEERKVGLLCSSNKSIAIVVVLLPVLERYAAMRLEPCWKNTRVQANLGGDIEGKFDDARLGIKAQSHTVQTGDSHEEVCQTGGEGLVFDKSFLFTFDQSRKEKDGLLNDPFVIRGRGDLANGNVDLLDRAVLDTWMR